MKKEIADLIEKGKRSVSAAEKLFNDGYYDFAISRAYYAMFYLTEAALLTKNLSYSKHAGVISGFVQHFVKENIFPDEFGKILRKTFDERLIGDYLTEIPSKEVALKVLNDAKRFVLAVAGYLERTA